MASKIQVKRGNKADLPILSDGEYGFCQDTSEIFIGNGGTNTKIYPTTSLDASSVTVEDIESMFESVNVEGVLSELGESILDILNGVTTVGKASDANTAGGFTVAKNVPSNAIFTDTVYTHPTTAGNKHIPTGGSVGQILKNTASGTATWQDESATTIANSLTETVTGKALDATQGKALKDLVDEHKAENATQFAEIRERIGIIYNVKDWQEVQDIVRSGRAENVFRVGDQLASMYDGKEIIWEVIGIDVDTPTDNNFTHSMTIQTKDCLHDIQFDAPEPSNTDSNRKSYGNNRYIHSAVKQWLNSDEATFNWQSQHQYDAAPTSSTDLYNGAGFLSRLDPELASVLGAVDKKVARNTVTDGEGQDSFSDKVFLISRVEAGLGTEGDETGEFVYPYYNGIADAGRIKQLNGTNRIWWLRSPSVSYSHYVRDVHASGTVRSIDARSTVGVSPACVII